MSWEDERGDYNPSGGDLRPGYSVDEPTTPRLFGEAGGFDVPRGGDEELLELIELWNYQGSDEVAKSFNDRGDDLLERFLERHMNDLPDGIEHRLRELLKQLERHGRTYDEDFRTGNFGSADRIKRLLKTQVLPIVQEVLHQGRRQKQARGSRDFIPGRASEARDQRQERGRQQVNERIMSEVSLMGEYSRLQELESRYIYRELTTEDEMNMHSAQKDVLERKIFLWKEANRDAQGAYSNTIARLQRDLRQTEAAVSHSMGALFGEGAAAAQAQVDRSLGAPGRSGLPRRPWDPRSQNIGASGGRPWDPRHQQRGVPSYRASYERDVMDPMRARYGSRRRGSRQASPEPPRVRGTPPQTPLYQQLGAGRMPQVIPKPRRLSREESRSEEMLRLRGGAGSKSKSKSRSPDFFAADEAELEEYKAAQALDPGSYEYAMAQDARRDAAIDLRSKTRSPEPVQFRGDRVFLSEELQAEWDKKVTKIGTEDTGFLGYMMPFRDDPALFQAAYGVKAKGVVDLFKINHRFLDYPSTVRAIVQVMSDADESIGLDKELPDSIMQVAGKRDWDGRTLGTILKSRAVGKKAGQGGQNVNLKQGLTKRHAFQLIKQGKPSGRGLGVRPDGIMIEIFNAWRRHKPRVSKTSTLCSSSPTTERPEQARASSDRPKRLSRASKSWASQERS